MWFSHLCGFLPSATSGPILVPHARHLSNFNALQHRSQHNRALINLNSLLSFAASNVLSISYPTNNPCTVLVDEKAEISAAKSTIADANRATGPGSIGALPGRPNPSGSAGDSASLSSASASASSSSSAASTASANSNSNANNNNNNQNNGGTVITNSNNPSSHSRSRRSVPNPGDGASAKMSQPQMAADRRADYFDNLVLHDISVDSTSTTIGDGFTDNGVSSPIVTTDTYPTDGDGEGGDEATTTRSTSFPQLAAQHDDGPIVSALFVPTTLTSYPPSALSQSPSLPLSSASGVPPESNEQQSTAYNDDEGDDDIGGYDGKQEQNFQSTTEQPIERSSKSASSSDYDDDSQGWQMNEEIFTTNDNDVTYVTSSTDPDLITNNSFDVELSMNSVELPVDGDIPSPTEYISTDDNDSGKLGSVEEEKLPNDDPLAHYEHLGPMEDAVDVELISLEDGPISGEEMRKSKSKLYYKNVQEKTAAEEEKVEIHTLPPANGIHQQPAQQSTAIPVTVAPQIPIYLVQESNSTTNESKEGAALPRLLVNISIATDHGTGTVQHSVYVLQVSIPTPPENIPKTEQSQENVDNIQHSCPPERPEPPPAPPCPIKCPNSSLFEKYQVVSIIEDESVSTEDVDSSSEAIELDTVTTTADLSPTTIESEIEPTSPTTEENDEEPTTTAEPGIPLQCPEAPQPVVPILILEGEDLSTKLKGENHPLNQL